MFNVRGLSVAFGEIPVLKDVSFDVQRGECVALIGRNGAGKSTLCDCLLGIIPQLRPAKISGLLMVGGHPMALQEVQSIGRRMGFALEDPEAQFVSLSVGDEVALTLAAHGRGVSEESVRGALRSFGIDALLGRAPGTLSEGEKRRVTLASLEAAQPEAMVLDDPTSALDGAGRKAFRDFVNRSRRRGCTILFTTHDMEIAAQSAQRCLGLRGGRLIVDLPLPNGANGILNGPLFSGTSGPLEPPPEGLGSVHTDGFVVEARGIAFSYPYTGTELFRDINIMLRPGEVFLVRGPNGLGKTTLLHLLAGLLRPSRGCIRVCDMLPRDIPMQRRGEICGLVFQNPEHQILMDRVGEEVLSGVPVSARANERCARRLEWIRSILPLPEARTDPRVASRGQKKLIALVTALAPGPRLLLLDELELGLDPVERARVVQILEMVRAHWRVAIVATSHDDGLMKTFTGAKTLDL